MSPAAHVDVPMPAITVPQSEILTLDEGEDRCVDVEGAPRSAKSWGACFWIWKLAWKYPGIQVFYCRYKEEGLIQLRDIWSKVTVHFPEWTHPTWNSKDHAYDFPNGRWIGDPENGGVYTGSRVFLSSLKVSEASDAAAIHGKYKGKTIAVVVVEEAQEVPQANYRGLKERLSQSRTPDGKPFKYPLIIVLVHNSVDEDHWIAADEFPLSGDTCPKPGHRHIRADLYSNAENLGPDVIAGYEADYPVGDPQRPTVIEGRRGLTQRGKPVYGGYFDRLVHVSDAVQPNPLYPILVGWDFGQEKPAIVFVQHIAAVGAIHLLGAIKGENVFLEDLAPKALEIQRRWFPAPYQFWEWADPTGATGNQGTRHTALNVLQGLGVHARFNGKANDPEVRDAAIQVIAGYMRRKAKDGQPAFQVNPRCIELKWRNGELKEEPSDLLTTSLAAGYVWSENALSDAHPNLRKPKKGTRYDDLMNALEYVVDGEQITVPTQAEMLRAADRVVIKAQKQALLAQQQMADRAARGPTGETLLEASVRIAKLNKANRDVDAYQGRRGPMSRRGRGGW